MHTLNLPANFTLYRGTRDIFNYERNSPVYFTFGSNGAQIAENAYAKPGTGAKVLEFKTAKKLVLLDMSKPETIVGLFNKASSNEDLLRSLAKSFSVKDGKVLRSSKFKHDDKVSRLVCRLGFDGYYAPRIKERKTTQGYFHPEIVLCKAASVLRGPGRPIAP